MQEMSQSVEAHTKLELRISSFLEGLEAYVAQGMRAHVVQETSQRIEAHSQLEQRIFLVVEGLEMRALRRISCLCRDCAHVSCRGTRGAPQKVLHMCRRVWMSAHYRLESARSAGRCRGAGFDGCSDNGSRRLVGGGGAEVGRARRDQRCMVRLAVGPTGG